MKVKTAHFNEETKYKVVSDARRPRRENTIDELKDYWLDIGDRFESKSNSRKLSVTL